MYVGRIVAVGRTKEDKWVVMYRVSSRSFPNRQAKVAGNTVSIIPKQGHESDVFSNPYISYNCLRIIGDFAVASNGSHTDPITEKIGSGMPVRDAIASALLGMDFEHDAYNTPRIAAVVDRKGKSGALGIVRSDAILVQQVDLAWGEVNYLATYEHDRPDKKFGDAHFTVQTSEEACEYILGKGVFADLERPITAACAIESGATYSISIKEAASA